MPAYDDSHNSPFQLRDGGEIDKGNKSTIQDSWISVVVNSESRSK